MFDVLVTLWLNEEFTNLFFSMDRIFCKKQLKRMINETILIEIQLNA